MGRTKGSGCLIKRGSVWYAKWVSDGVQHLISTHEKDKKKAMVKLNELVHPYQTKSDIETLENLQSKIRVLENDAKKTPKEKAVRLNFAVEVYKSDINQSDITEGTEKAYDSKFTQLRKFLKDQKKEFVWQVTEKDATDFMLKVKDRCGVGTFNDYLITFKTIINVLMKHDTNIKKNVFAGMKLLKVDKSQKRRELTDDEVKSLIKSAEERHEDEGLLFKLGAYTGLRKIDCVNLKWCNVDFTARMIRTTPIKTQKDGMNIIIPIVETLFTPLKDAYDKRDTSEYVLPRLHDVSSARLSAIINAVFKNADIITSVKDKDGKTRVVTGFHSLRHTFASKLHRSGMPIGQIRQILGHTGIAMSLKYTHVNENDLMMPDFTDKTVNIRISKESYDLVMNLRKGSETFDECIKRICTTPTFNSEEVMKIRKEQEECKAKADRELSAFIDEIMEEPAKQSA